MFEPSHHLADARCMSCPICRVFHESDHGQPFGLEHPQFWQTGADRCWPSPASAIHPPGCLILDNSHPFAPSVLRCGTDKEHCPQSLRKMLASCQGAGSLPVSLATLWRGKLQLPSKGPGAARVFHVCVADLPFTCTSWCGDPWQRSGAFHRAQKRLFAIRSVARKRGELGALATGCVKGGPVGAGPLSISEHHRLSF